MSEPKDRWVDIFVNKDFSWSMRDFQVWVNRFDAMQRKRWVIKNIEWEEIDERMCSSPTFNIGQDAAQRLMDSMWSAGIRPTWEHSEGQLGATREHLADLKKLLFHKEKIDV